MPEVLRSLPHLYKAVHELNAASLNPRIMLPEAIAQYRDRLPPDESSFDPLALPVISGADYTTRGDLAGDGSSLGELRGGRGFASIGEVLLLDQPAAADRFDAVTGEQLYRDLWRFDLGAGAQFPAFVDGSGVPESARVSTDTHDGLDASGNAVPDEVIGDAEEANLLFAGMSNLVTTRSDTFTVYFKVRSFRQNPQTGAWDATDPEYIVDDSRYVMLVDRSEVNRPTDKPKILYLEKLPN
ncbi:MAG: hypothetical protein ACYTG1_10755, partial [Planctomycetota bacterium]|jgi:hypothetical protein